MSGEIKPLWIYSKIGKHDLSEKVVKDYSGEWYETEYLGMTEMVSVGDRVMIFNFDEESGEYKTTGIERTIKVLDDCYGHRVNTTDRGWKYLVQFEI